ncbi:MAG: hypothetical protein WAN36_11230 [Calditrichia bacterium]
MFTKLSRHRAFEYTPRRYDPDKERREGKRPQIQFRQMRHRRKTRPYIWLILMLAFILYIMVMLTKVVQHF